jgi:hypothetical protein
VHDVLLRIHVAAGIVGLLSLWVPLAAPKGGRLHRRVGRVFVGAMAIVSLTAIALCAGRLLAPHDPGARASALFLGYLAVLTGAGAWKGMRVLRAKDRRRPSSSALDLGIAASVLLAGLAMCGVAIAWGSGFVGAFALLGVAGGVADLRYWLRAPEEPMHWFFEHMGDMVGTGIAAITAFLVQGARGFSPDGSTPLLVWLLPTIVGIPALVAMQSRCRKRFAATPRPAAAPGPGRAPSAKAPQAAAR